MKNLPKAPTVRMPGLCIDVGQAVNGGSRLSAIPTSAGATPTLQGSVRGAKPEADAGPSERRLVIDQPRYQKPPRNK